MTYSLELRQKVILSLNHGQYPNQPQKKDINSRGSRV